MQNIPQNGGVLRDNATQRIYFTPYNENSNKAHLSEKEKRDPFAISIYTGTYDPETFQHLCWT